MKKIQHFAVPALLMALSGSTLASGYCGGCMLGGNGDQGAFYPGINQALIQGSSFQTLLSITNAISSRNAFSGGPRPLAQAERTSMAAGGAMPTNLWASFGQTSSEDTRSTQRMDMDTDNFVIGADYNVAPNMVLGITAAGDDGDGRQKVGDVKMTTRGYSFAPYFAWQLSKDWALDAALGWGEGKFNASDSLGSSRAKADRFFSGLNLSYTQWAGNWQMVGKGSYLYAEEKYGDTRSSLAGGGSLAGTKVTNKLDQFRLGVQAAYWMSNGVQPYVGLTYVSNQDPSPKAAAGTKNQKDGWIGQLGVNFFNASNTIFGGLSYSSEDRDNFKSDVWTANINFRF